MNYFIIIFVNSQVEYTAVVEGRSPLGNLISFMHDGTSTSISNVNKITVQPLIPQTNYLFKVAALTTGGEGMQVRANGLTNDAASEFGELSNYTMEVVNHNHG